MKKAKLSKKDPLMHQQLIDEDSIRCPKPSPADGEDLSAFMNMIEISRICSMAYKKLFTAAALAQTPNQMFKEIEMVRLILERWRQSIPQICRPGMPLQCRAFHKPGFQLVALQHHIWYHLLQIALARLEVHASHGQSSHHKAQANRYMVDSARSLVEITQQIPIEASTPMK